MVEQAAGDFALMFGSLYAVIRAWTFARGLLR